MFCKKGVSTNLTKFSEEKGLWQSLFFNKVTGLRPATLFKKRPWHRCFSENFVRLLRTPFFTEHLWWLLLPLIRYITLILDENLKTTPKSKVTIPSYTEYFSLVFTSRRRDMINLNDMAIIITVFLSVKIFSLFTY